MTRLFLTLLLALAVSSAANADDKEKKSEKPGKGRNKNVISLFDGKTLKGWKLTEFGGDGEVSVKDGNLLLEQGADLTGITWADAKKIPRTNYEISCEAQRVDGGDFFCGLTIPVQDSACSLILGGWGGGVCGISCLNGADASENETTFYREFKKGQWYKVRMRVTDDRIRAWIDEKEIIDVNTGDVKVDVRIEVELSKPLGFATWQTTAALRKIKLRKLTPKEVEQEATRGE